MTTETALSSTAAPTSEGASTQTTAAATDAATLVTETAATTTTQGAEPTATDQADAAAATTEEGYDFKFSEGVEIDGESLTEFKGIAKELGLKGDHAQKVASLGEKMMQKWQAGQQEAFAAQAAQWADSSRADKEFGGEKLGENLAIAQKALEQFGTPELRQLLEDTRLGNNPEMIRFMVRAGKAISDDSIVTGGIGGNTGKNDARRVYPNSDMNP